MNTLFENIYRKTSLIRESIFSCEDSTEIKLTGNCFGKVEKKKNAEDDYDNSYKVHFIMECKIKNAIKFLAFMGTYSTRKGTEEQNYGTDFEKDDVTLLFNSEKDAKDFKRSEGQMIIESKETDTRLFSVADFGMDVFYTNKNKDWFKFTA